MQTTLACPHCHGDIHLESVLVEQAEARAQAQFLQQQRELEARQRDLDQRQADQDAEIERRLSTEETRLRQRVREELAAANAQKDLELQEKSNRIQQLQLEKGKLLRQQREVEEARAGLDAEIEQRLRAERPRIEETARQRVTEQAELRLAEKDLVIKQLREQAHELQRRAEQGSQQVQGEVQELALESMLRQAHPFDTFEEVRKGELGADLVQVVRNAYGRECGVILYESKRTKAFNEDWVPKLKHDMGLRGAALGVLVTQALPKGVTSHELRDENVIVCSFADVKALSCVLRQSLIRVEAVQTVQANQGGKMQLLYNYLTGAEFKLQLSAIQEAFRQMQDDLSREKKSTLARWKAREKQMNAVLVNLSGVVGSIGGIAGQAVASFDEFEEVAEPAALLED